MNAKEILEGAADTIEKLANAIGDQLEESVKLETKVAEAADLRKQAEDARQAAQGLQKQAQDQKAAAAGLAKTAASAVFDAGLVSDERRRDELAVNLLDHGQALEELAKVAALVEAPRVGRLEKRSASAEADSDAVWSQAVRSVNASLPGSF